MTYDLSKNQIKFACALPAGFKSINEIKRSIYDGSESRVHWKELVNLGIAEKRQTRSKIHLRRGANWHAFYEQHGYKDTELGLGFFKLEEDLAIIFKPANVLPFRPL